MSWRGPMGPMGRCGFAPGPIGDIEAILSALEDDGRMRYTDSDGNHWCGLTDWVAQSIRAKLLAYKTILERQGATGVMDGVCDGPGSDWVEPPPRPAGKKGVE